MYFSVCMNANKKPPRANGRDERTNDGEEKNGKKDDNKIYTSMNISARACGSRVLSIAPAGKTSRRR